MSPGLGSRCLNRKIRERAASELRACLAGISCRAAWNGRNILEVLRGGLCDTEAVGLGLGTRRCSQEWVAGSVDIDGLGRDAMERDAADRDMCCKRPAARRSTGTCPVWRRSGRHHTTRRLLTPPASTPHPSSVCLLPSLPSSSPFLLSSVRPARVSVRSVEVGKILGVALPV